MDKIRVDQPDNRCVKFLDKAYYSSLAGADRDSFYACVRTGIDNPDSGMGCYATKPQHYTQFKPFFGKVIGDYHKNDTECALVHVNDWDASGVGEGGVLDLAKLGMTEPISMRVRVGRNLAAFNLPGAMDKDERIKFEQTMLAAFAKLIAMEGYGGAVYSITPDFGEAGANPNKIDDAKYQELVDKHVMFKDMDADPYLKSAGIASDWPYGRGCWMSDDEQKIIWIGEEDQLRIMVMKKGYLINEASPARRDPPPPPTHSPASASALAPLPAAVPPTQSHAPALAPTPLLLRPSPAHAHAPAYSLRSAQPPLHLSFSKSPRALIHPS